MAANLGSSPRPVDLGGFAVAVRPFPWGSPSSCKDTISPFFVGDSRYWCRLVQRRVHLASRRIPAGDDTVGSCLGGSRNPLWSSPPRLFRIERVVSLGGIRFLSKLM